MVENITNNLWLCSQLYYLLQVESQEVIIEIL